MFFDVKYCYECYYFDMLKLLVRKDIFYSGSLKNILYIVEGGVRVRVFIYSLFKNN